MKERYISKVAAIFIVVLFFICTFTHKLIHRIDLALDLARSSSIPLPRFAFGPSYGMLRHRPLTYKEELWPR